VTQSCSSSPGPFFAGIAQDSARSGGVALGGPDDPRPRVPQSEYEEHCRSMPRTPLAIVQCRIEFWQTTLPASGRVALWSETWKAGIRARVTGACHCGREPSARARKRRSRSCNRYPHNMNVVLVHGGFVDGSGWAAVYKILKKDGYNVVVVQKSHAVSGRRRRRDSARDRRARRPRVARRSLLRRAVITEAGTRSKGRRARVTSPPSLPTRANRCRR